MSFLLGLQVKNDESNWLKFAAGPLLSKKKGHTKRSRKD